MARLLRRARGTLLRIALHRPLAVALGLGLLAPAIWVGMREYRWETWLSDGAVLVLGATGAALVLTGLSGRRADWEE
jgi:hypothetical protein